MTNRGVCDVDGVLADFNNPFRRQLEEMTGKKPAVWPPQHWNWYKDYCSSKELAAAWKEIDTSSGAWWKRLDAYEPKAYKDLDALAMMGDLYFLTARWGEGVKSATEQWIWETQGFECPTVLVGANPEGKAAIVNALDITYFIDDRPENLEAVYEGCGVFRHGNADRKLFLFDQSWNRNAQLTPGLEKRVIRVSSLAEVVEIVGG